MSVRLSRSLFLAAALIAVTLLGWFLYSAFEPHREARRFQHERFSFMSLGIAERIVLSRVGAPDQNCPGGKSVRLLKGQIPDAGMEEKDVLAHLERQTAAVLVYFFPEPSKERDQIPCGPAYLDTAVGLDSMGNVLWFTILRGEDAIRYSVPGS